MANTYISDALFSHVFSLASVTAHLLDFDPGKSAGMSTGKELVHISSEWYCSILSTIIVNLRIKGVQALLCDVNFPIHQCMSLWNTATYASTSLLPPVMITECLLVELSPFAEIASLGSNNIDYGLSSFLTPAVQATTMIQFAKPSFSFQCHNMLHEIGSTRSIAVSGVICSFLVQIQICILVCKASATKLMSYGLLIPITMHPDNMVTDYSMKFDKEIGLLIQCVTLTVSLLSTSFWTESKPPDFALPHWHLSDIQTLVVSLVAVERTVARSFWFPTVLYFSLVCNLNEHDHLKGVLLYYSGT